MSETFDEVVAASWARYEQRLVAWVRAAGDGYVQIDPAEGDGQDISFVTLDWDEDGLIEAELVGLSAAHDFEVLKALGWRPPAHAGESPFWGVLVSVDEVEVLAGMVSGALRFVFGVADPAFVSSELAVPTGSSLTPPTEGVDGDDVSDGLCCVDGSHGGGEGGSMKRTRRPGPPVTMPSGFVGFRFPSEVILVAVRWYLRYGLSYRDLEELLAERGIEVDHVTLYRWVQRFTPLLIEAARPCRHLASDRWFVDETYVKVSGVWRYVYRAVDQRGQVIDVYVSQRRDIASARTFFTAALSVHGVPTEVVTDRAPALANVIENLVPAALHNTGQYENNRVECDHGRLKARLRPMRGLKTHRTASVVIRGHAFIQNLRRGHYELAVDATPVFRLATAFDELTPAI